VLQTPKANKDKPVSDSCGTFTIAKNGNLMVLDSSRKFYSGTNLEKSST
jgi:hypothetical protein